MNYTLDEEEKQILQLLETARAEGSFNENAYTHETKYNNCNIHYGITFCHRSVYCKIMISSKCGSFSFYMNNFIGNLGDSEIKRKYCTTKSHFFGLIRETPLDVNHPVVDAALTVHKEIMQKATEVDALKRQKTWDKLLSKSKI